MVNAEAVRPLRREVLKPKRKTSGPEWPGDDDPRTLHLVMKKGKQTLAAISVAHELRADLGSEVWRVRGPVVREDNRRQSNGRKLMEAVQAVVEKRGGGLWTRVPIEALPFYSALGFKAAADGGKGSDDLVLTWRPKP